MEITWLLSCRNWFDNGVCVFVRSFWLLRFRRKVERTKFVLQLEQGTVTHTHSHTHTHTAVYNDLCEDTH